MRVAYLDCSSGISGNMIIGALLDAGLPAAHLKKELSKLRITDHALWITKTRKNGIASLYFEVKTGGKQPLRRLSDITRIIHRSSLSPSIKSKSSAIFRKLAEAEAKVHGIPVNKVHFHEIGAVDTIVDIVGTLVGLNYLGIKKLYCSPINLGSGTVKTAHGRLSVPAPATAALLKGIPAYGSQIKKELTTPTGAVIVSALVNGFGPLPRMTAERTGYGAGWHDLKQRPNLLRVTIGEMELETLKDAVLLIEANIDDMEPKLYDRAIAAIMGAGALDAYIAPIRMKKRRNAVKLTAICQPEDRERVMAAIFEKTTTFGARTYLVEREKLDRKIIRTKAGRVKLGRIGNKLMTAALEPDDYLKRKSRVPRPSPLYRWP
ncbi:MAG TPA: nickel pincer cofactor biosynthesis protein LarC [Candidatus Omnitrophota bacterium]|nr:nickel pincer cofactor biosynthesis protein LarC [Candidatus Omnitrophota bacterium]